MPDYKNWGKNIKPNDVIYTPKELAKLMVNFCNINEGDKVLDPCRGGGVFFNEFPTNCVKDWCEIREHRDFFDFNENVEWIIGNPPYSLWNDWIKHTIKISNKFCYIMGSLNLTPPRIQEIFDNGFIITKIHFCKVGWWFSPSIIIICEKGDLKDSVVSTTRKTYWCDICKATGRDDCYRGRTIKGKKYAPNECSNLNSK